MVVTNEQRKTPVLEGIVDDSLSERSRWQKTKDLGRNWAIDTATKTVGYAPFMAILEACHGNDVGEILDLRAKSALVDSVAAKAYTFVADYADRKTRSVTLKVSRASIGALNGLRKLARRDELGFGGKRKVRRAVEGTRKYVTDTASMIGVYSAFYWGILASKGAPPEEIKSCLLGGAAIALGFARIFRKYILMPSRKKFGYVAKAKKRKI